MNVREWLAARRRAKEDEALFVDLVTGHASARFTWVDVRPEVERERTPFGATDTAITVAALRAGRPLPVRQGAELVVFGSDRVESEEAAALLRRRGYEVLSAPRGYETLKRHGLV